MSPDGRGLYTSVFAFLMNKKKYESLPDDLKKVIDDNSGMAWSKAMGKVWVDAEKPGRGMAEKRGNSLQDLPEDDVVKMQEMAKPVLAAWAEEMDDEGLDGKALLESAETLLDKYTNE
jgi:TRAP-type C4-dicarboxylate transport system substrate-binding protein